MTKFLKLIQLTTVVSSASVLALSTGVATQQNTSIINLEKDANKEWRVEKLPNLSSWALSMTEFNDYLYMTLSLGEILKMDSNGNRTMIRQGNMHERVAASIEFNNNLYLGYENGDLAKLDKQDHFSYLMPNFSTQFRTFVIFNDFLYFGLQTGEIYKMDKDENVTLVKLDIDFPGMINKMIIFDNHLYVAGMNGIMFKIDKNEKVVDSVSLTPVRDMIIYNGDLYLGTMSYLAKVDKEGKITFISWAFDILTMAILDNELYLGMWTQELWKMDSNAELIKVDKIANYYARVMLTFNNELYISYDVYGFSKLTNK